MARLHKPKAGPYIRFWVMLLIPVDRFFFRMRWLHWLGRARAMEGEEDEPKHVDCRQQRGQHADDPENRVSAREGAEEDLVLAEEAGEERDARDRNRADEERPVGDRQLAPQPAHAPQILLAAERVKGRAGPSEASLVEGQAALESFTPRMQARIRDQYQLTASTSGGEAGVDGSGARERLSVYVYGAGR